MDWGCASLSVGVFSQGNGLLVELLLDLQKDRPSVDATSDSRKASPT